MSDIPTKTCRGCEYTLPATKEYFYVDRGYLTSECKHCLCFRVKCNYKKNPSGKKGYIKGWIDDNKDKHAGYNRKTKLKARYGLTEEEYKNLYAKQKGLCAICGKSETKLDINGNMCKLCIDHDHKTGKVRGLLCDRCNLGLGYFKDDKNNLQKAIRYLEAS